MPVVCDVSVVIPAHRAAATIGRTIASVLPALPPHNIIVVLDGPDAELESAARDAGSTAQGSIDIVVLPGHCGAATCRNAGLARVTSNHVMFLDADDYLEGDVLAYAHAAATTEDADIVIGRYAHEMPDGSRTYVDSGQIYQPLDCQTVMTRWLTGYYTPPCAVLWRSGHIRDLGGWDESLKKNQDGDMVYRSLTHGPRLALSAGGCSIYSQGDAPTRISRQQTPGTLESQFTVLEKLRCTLAELPFDPSRELARSYYELARLAFSHGITEIGHRAENRARGLGLKGQHGSVTHRLLASVFGLAGKQHLVRRARHYMGKSL
jgi:hypothetical protein